jgi:flagellar basal body-associated protein FliL
MEIAIIVVVFGVAALFVLFILAKRMLKLAVRLMLGALLVLILVAGGLFWWWSRGGEASEGNSNRTTAPRPRATSR